MRNRVAMVIILLAFVVLAAGCETTKGLGKGAAETAKGLSQSVGGVACGIGSAAEGIGKDSYSFYKFILTADNWIKENLW